MFLLFVYIANARVKILCNEIFSGEKFQVLNKEHTLEANYLSYYIKLNEFKVNAQSVEFILMDTLSSSKFEFTTEGRTDKEKLNARKLQDNIVINICLLVFVALPCLVDSG